MSRLKLMTVVGTRPEIIRLSRVIPAADQFFDHMFVHTGQNYDPNLKDIFFSDLRLRQPDVYMPSSGVDPIKQVGIFLSETERLIREFKPDRFLVLGDTNSALTAWIAKRHAVPVFHMEAGNRCFDDRVPEEINRRMIDQCSDVLLPYTQRSRENLIREGHPSHRIFVLGNPILEVFKAFDSEIKSSKILSALELREREYFLVTLHRAENVDVESRFKNFIEAFQALNLKYRKRLILSVHPRTKIRLEKMGYSQSSLAERGIICSEPFGFFDFAHLEANAACVLTDSGTVQEECCIFGIPNVTLRDVTERPETLDVGSNVISGSEPGAILSAVAMAMQPGNSWEAPAEYRETKVAEKVVRLIGSHWNGLCR